MRLELIDRYTGPDELALPFRDPSVWMPLALDLGGTDWTAEVVLVDDEAIARWNGQYRGKPTATDVLSFSYLLPEGEAEPSLAAGERGAAYDLWRDEPEGPVGEILIAPQFVARRCAERGWPLQHELPLLIVHGCLHLLGWDHEEEDERDRMRALEAELLARAGLPHPLAGT